MDRVRGPQRVPGPRPRQRHAARHPLEPPDRRLQVPGRSRPRPDGSRHGARCPRRRPGVHRARRQAPATDGARRRHGDAVRHRHADPVRDGVRCARAGHGGDRRPGARVEGGDGGDARHRPHEDRPRLRGRLGAAGRAACRAARLDRRGRGPPDRVPADAQDPPRPARRPRRARGAAARALRRRADAVRAAGRVRRGPRRYGPLLAPRVAGWRARRWLARRGGARHRRPVADPRVARRPGGGAAAGALSLLVAVLPEAAIAPILVFIGLEITAQGFLASPPRHGAAVALAFVPVAAAVVLIETGGVLSALGASPSHLTGDAALTHGTLLVLGNGFILTAVVWGWALVGIIERRFEVTGLLFAFASVATLVGVIHSPEPSGAVFWPWAPPSAVPARLAGAYGALAAICWLAAARGRANWRISA